VGQQDPAMEDEVKYRYYSVIQLYRRPFLQDNAQRYIYLLSQLLFNCLMYYVYLCICLFYFIFFVELLYWTI
jgi:hypothetical protein